MEYVASKEGKKFDDYIFHRSNLDDDKERSLKQLDFPCILYTHKTSKKLPRSLIILSRLSIPRSAIIQTIFSQMYISLKSLFSLPLRKNFHFFIHM